MRERSADLLVNYTESWLLRFPDIRFALLFAPRARKTHALAALVLSHELFEAGFGLSDQRIAESKLNWWAQELAESKAGRAQHPLTRTLSEVGLADFAAGVAAVSALGLELTSSTPADFPSQVDSARSWGVQLARFYAPKSCGPEALASVFVALGLLRKLQLSARPGRYGPAVLPMNMLAKHQLSAASLSEARAAVAIGEQARRLEELSADIRPLAFTELAALAANAQLTARAIRRASQREFPQVNPLSRLYLGWRAALSVRPVDQSP